MGETERLQKAVITTISAGYQLNKEAFELLRTVMGNEDPVEIVTRIIEKLRDQDEKPFVIDQNLLEQLLTSEQPNKEIIVPSAVAETKATTEINMTESKKMFHPFAKEVQANLAVIDDPTAKLSSNGTVNDYLDYFKDRFRRLEKILRQRIDVKTAASVLDALKAPQNTKLKIICIVTEKRESKQRTILAVEDLQANATVLVPQNATEELKKRARSLLLDQVVCISVAKTRGTLLIAEDIVFPDVAQRTPHKASEPVYVALTSDLHIGSTKFRKEAFNRFVLWLNGKYGNEQTQEIASHVKYVLIAGDIVDGIGIYPNQVKELAIRDVYKQYRLAARFIEQIPDYVEVVIIPGNHDASRKAAPQPALPEAYLEHLEESRRIHSLGNPCTISLHEVEVLMDHGRSLDDVMATVPGMDYRHPERAMKLLLQGRHLAPVYGGKTMISPEKRDFLVVDRVPDIFHAGHIHTLGFTSYRGVSIINSGGWQEQTDYMARMGFIPTVGHVPVINLQTMETHVVQFN